MDTETFNPLMISIRREIFNVEQKMKGFTAAHVSLDLKEEIAARLEKIDQYNDICQGKIFDLIMTLNDDIPSDLEKTNSLRRLADDLNSKVLNNSVQVREKLADLIINRPRSMIEQEAFDRQKEKEEKEESAKKEKEEKEESAKKEKEKREETAKESKIGILLAGHLAKCLKFSEEISELKDVEEMSEQEIRLALIQWKEVWDKKLEKLNEKKETLEEDFLYDIADDEIDSLIEFRSKHDQLVKDVSDKYKLLIAKDKELGLYTLAPNKSKESVCYPEVFSGKFGENVHKFVADFKAAIEAHQVRTKDEVKTLRKYLEGDAKIVVGENTLTIQNAFDALKATFGNPRILWKKHKEMISKSITKYSWGKDDSVDRRNTISKFIDFMNEATTLSVKHPELEREIMSDSTYSFIYDLLPKVIQRDIAKEKCKSKEKLSHEATFKIVLEILDSHRQITIEMLQSSGQPETEGDYSKPSEKTPKSHNVKLNDEHDCSDSYQCRTDEWDFLGCIQLYSIEKIDERIAFMKSKRICFKCGSNYRYPHTCVWNDEKEDAKCTAYNCIFAAAICRAHANTDNTSEELKDWLSRNSMKFVANSSIVKSSRIKSDEPADSPCADFN